MTTLSYAVQGLVAVGEAFLGIHRPIVESLEVHGEKRQSLEQIYPGRV